MRRASSLGRGSADFAGNVAATSARNRLRIAADGLPALKTLGLMRSLLLLLLPLWIALPVLLFVVSPPESSTTIPTAKSAVGRSLEKVKHGKN